LKIIEGVNQTGAACGCSAAAAVVEMKNDFSSSVRAPSNLAFYDILNILVEH
jgi:hypothetical protein